MNKIAESLKYHSNFPKGKWGMKATKPLSVQDMSLAYSPGVAYPCLEIQSDLANAFEYTAKGNLVAVISNGTAVLGLGDIGALASKPVMEGKCVLMNKMSGVYGVDIEINEKDPKNIIEIIRKISPSFGAINLEDIKAPECFVIEEALQDLGIPVFHDDQHGTAVVATAGIENVLKLTDRSWDSIRVVASGAGAAGIACLDSMVNMGLNPKNIMLFDSKGLTNKYRNDLNKYKAKYASEVEVCTLEEALHGADVFLGVSAANALKADWIKGMSANPILFCLANPDPEIMPELAREARPDCIIATGRSDYPNQVNNILCFPYIFRGALDAKAERINDDMKRSCIKAIAEIARNDSRFGVNHIIPDALDERLGLIVSKAVAVAANVQISDHGRKIEKMLNVYSEKYFDIADQSKAIKMDVSNVVVDILNVWDVSINVDDDADHIILPMGKSCEGENLVWFFGLDSNPWIAYSEAGGKIVDQIRKMFDFVNIPHVPVINLEQRNILEKRKDFCGRLSMDKRLKMEFKSDSRNAAYLTLLLSGVEYAQASY